jgi:hypothetical protein
MFYEMELAPWMEANQAGGARCWMESEKFGCLESPWS